MNDSRQLIGHIVRLQVQTAHLKRGESPRRWYDPAPITVVPRLEIDASGVRGVLDDGTILEDVHNESHAISRYRGDNGVSIGFTSHYRAMRDRFGDHLIDGIAGENILIECDDRHSVSSLAPHLVVVTDQGPVRIDSVTVAAPCVEFSKFSLGYANDQKPDRSVTEALRFLHQGMRGFYATARAASVIRTGDAVYRIEHDTWNM